MKIEVGYRTDNEATRAYRILERRPDGSLKVCPFTVMTRPFDGSQYLADGNPIIVNKLNDIHEEEVPLKEKGVCKKHGEFILTEGCPQCLAERRAAGIRPEQDEMEEGLNAESLTLANVGEPITITGSLLEETAAETALVKIAPDKDAGYIKLLAETTKLLEYSTKLVIKGIDDKKVATNDLIIMGDLGKEIEAVKKEWLGPIDEHRKTVFDMFRQLTDPLAQAIKQTKAAMIEYDREQNRIHQEQEEINRLRLEAAKKEMELTGKITEPVKLVEVAPEAPKRVSTDLGTVGQRMIRKWELLDFAQVPHEYLILDSAKIGKVVRAGIPSIPGIRIWEEPILTVNAR